MYPVSFIWIVIACVWREFIIRLSHGDLWENFILQGHKVGITALITTVYLKNRGNKYSEKLSVLSLSFFKIYFNWRLITLQYCGGFCHSYTWISHGCTCSPSWTPLTPSSPSHPSESSQCTSLEHPALCKETGLVTISHMIIHMFQCYSLKLSHPHHLTQSPKVCSLHLCLCYLAYRLIITIFLNSICMH